MHILQNKKLKTFFDKSQRIYLKMLRLDLPSTENRRRIQHSET